MKKIILMFIIITFTSLCNSKPSLEVPVISNDGKKGKCVSGQWETVYGCFAFVVIPCSFVLVCNWVFRTSHQTHTY